MLLVPVRCPFVGSSRVAGRPCTRRECPLTALSAQLWMAAAYRRTRRNFKNCCGLSQPRVSGGVRCGRAMPSHAPPGVRCRPLTRTLLSRFHVPRARDVRNNCAPASGVVGCPVIVSHLTHCVGLRLTLLGGFSVGRPGQVSVPLPRAAKCTRLRLHRPNRDCRSLCDVWAVAVAVALSAAFAGASA